MNSISMNSVSKILIVDSLYMYVTQEDSQVSRLTLFEGALSEAVTYTV